MGVVGDIVGGVFGASASDNAADAQRAASADASQIQREFFETTQENIKPFREAGAASLDQLQGLVTDPQQQKSFIDDNPFFDALSQRSTETVLQNAAAKGKVGSGGTAEALQNSLVLLGNDLLNQRISQTQNLAGLGQSSSALHAQQSQQTAQNLGGLAIQGGNASAAGQIAKAQQIQGGISNVNQSVGQVLPALLCDFHAEENIQKVGRLDNGLALYSFNYIGDDKPYINVIAQEVEQIIPDAVHEKDGFKYIDVSKVWYQ